MCLVLALAAQRAATALATVLTFLVPPLTIQNS